jgi:hypothetical protein
MPAWTDNELRRIGGAEELEIAPVHRDGTWRASRPIWVVRDGDDLYVRAAYGSGSGWHRIARASGQARISAGGAEQDVTVEDAASACSTRSMPPIARSTAAGTRASSTASPIPITA